MNTAAVDRIAKAVLYEGYMLYPYRPSAVKNQQRFNFGVVYPQPFSQAGTGSDPWIMQTECLVQGNSVAELEVRVRFLQLVERSVEAVELALAPTLAPAAFHPVKSLTVEGQTFYSWQEAVERELDLPATDLGTVSRHSVLRPFQLPASAAEEDLRDRQGVLHGTNRANPASHRRLRRSARGAGCGASVQGRGERTKHYLGSMMPIASAAMRL